MLQGFEIKFNIYANNEQEVEDAKCAIIDFISQHAQCGRAVTATKIAEAARNWQKNPIVKNSIIKYFS